MDALGPVLNYPAPDGVSLELRDPTTGRPVTVLQHRMSSELFRSHPVASRQIWPTADCSHRVRVVQTPHGARAVFLIDATVHSPNDAVS